MAVAVNVTDEPTLVGVVEEDEPSEGPAVNEGAMLNVQLVLLPESVILKVAVAIAVALVLLESLTSKYDMVRVPWGSINHWVGVELERRDKRAPEAPLRVIVPTMV